MAFAWSDEERVLIQEQYGKASAKEVAEMCNRLWHRPIRTAGAVRAFASKEKVKAECEVEAAIRASEAYRLAVSLPWSVRR